MPSLCGAAQAWFQAMRVEGTDEFTWHKAIKKKEANARREEIKANPAIFDEKDPVKLMEARRELCKSVGKWHTFCNKDRPQSDEGPWGLE